MYTFIVENMLYYQDKLCWSNRVPFTEYLEVLFQKKKYSSST